jgi:nicotinate dehydrogenase subunit A
MATIQLQINTHSYTIDADPQTSLLTVLRERLDLTGSKYGCGEGQCGACTVLIDGNAQRSCITRVGTVAQKQITTIEGLANGEQLHLVQEAFLDAAALQCGYCTSGMIMQAVALLKRNPAPSQSEVVEFMDGNVCRCGTYPRIVSAIQNAGRAMKAAAANKRGRLALIATQRARRDAPIPPSPATRTEYALTLDNSAQQRVAQSDNMWPPRSR